MKVEENKWKNYFLSKNVFIVNRTTYFLFALLRKKVCFKQGFEKSASAQLKHMHSWIGLQNKTVFHSAQNIRMD
jgi:hypothetical protein